MQNKMDIRVGFLISAPNSRDQVWVTETGHCVSAGESKEVWRCKHPLMHRDAVGPFMDDRRDVLLAKIATALARFPGAQLLGAGELQDGGEQ